MALFLTAFNKIFGNIFGTQHISNIKNTRTMFNVSDRNIKGKLRILQYKRIHNLATKLQLHLLQKINYQKSEQNEKFSRGWFPKHQKTLERVFPCKQDKQDSLIAKCRRTVNGTRDYNLELNELVLLHRYHRGK